MAGKELVLVTGASGFLAVNILKSFLSAGYQIRGTVRSEETAHNVRKEFPNVPESDLSFVIVPDIAAAGALDQAVKDASGIIHTAAPVFYGRSDYAEEMMQPAILGTRYLLDSIQQHGSNIEAVVITSSFTTIQDFSKGADPGHVYTEKDWSPATVEWLKKAPGLTYPMSKILSEREAWAWYENNAPEWKLSTICPGYIYGPVSKNTTLSGLNRSSIDIWRLLSGEAAEVPPTNIPTFIDVRDTAEAHLKAYQRRAEGRFIPTGGKYLFATVCEILAENFPERADLIPKPTAEQLSVETFTVNNELTKRELGMTFRGLEECIVDSACSYLQLS